MSSKPHGEDRMIDFQAEGLLDGLQGERRAERIELLERLHRDGVGLDEMRRSTAEGTIVFLAAERVIGGSERYTAPEISSLTGADIDFLTSIRRAMGLLIPGPDEAVYTQGDLESVRMTGALREAGISDEEMLELTRTLGRGLSQAAEGMRALVLRLVLEAGVSESELAQRYAFATSQLAPMLGPLITNLLTLHLRQMTESEAINAAERSGGKLPGAREVTICFADLVGFTRLGEQLAPDQLSHLAGRLETLTTEVIEPPVRLVKTIGDAVMLSSPDAPAALDCALGLLGRAAAEGEEFPQLRAGLASGAALARSGDWFGRPVNLASRITAFARPDSVLVERTVRDLSRDAFYFSFVGERRLRGVREPVGLYRARRLQER